MSEGGRDERETSIQLPPLLASGPIGRRPPTRPTTSLWLALIIVLLLLLVGLSPWWAPTFAELLPWGTAAAPQAPPGPSTAALDQRLASLEQKLSKPAPPPAPLHDAEAAAALNRQQAALQSLADRVTALEQKPAPAAGADPAIIAQLRGEIDRLTQANSKLDASLAETSQRLDKLSEARGSEQAISADRFLLMALGELRSAAAASGPYASELATVEALARDKPDLAAPLKQLDGDAATGLPSLALLTRHFTDQAVPAILRADAAAAPAAAGWSERLWRRLRGLVLIRHLDTGAADATATPTDRLLATAETALGRGDLAAAVDAVGSLGGAPAQAAAPWLAEARQRLAAETLLAHLAQTVSAGLGGRSAPGDTPGNTDQTDRLRSDPPVIEPSKTPDKSE
jgi:hypothetical protein